jgi:hypothetical protein
MVSSSSPGIALRWPYVGSMRPSADGRERDLLVYTVSEESSLCFRLVPAIIAEGVAHRGGIPV